MTADPNWQDSRATSGRDAARSVVIDNIGLLVTNDPALGDGPLGIRRDAAVVITDGLVEEVTGAGAVADTRIDAEGMCVIPGFVDSHSHLVFAGDRAEEFAARMAGQAYDGGGIRVTTDATRNASSIELDRLVTERLRRAHLGGTTTMEIKSGYGLNVADEARTLQVAEGHTTETTFLGAHLVPHEYLGRPDDYIDLVCGDMLAAAAPHSRWIDAFCEEGAFDADQCRRVLEAGRDAGLGLRLHGNQLGPGSGVRLAVEMGCASVDHCTYLTDDDIDALAGSDTVATLLPAADFSTRQPYPDARRLLDAGATVAIAANCNPGSSYTTSIPFCLALAVRDMHMTSDEALAAATIGGATALGRTDVGRLSPRARGHLAILDAPSHHHFAYQPGQNLIRLTIGPYG
ncbi:MAG: imidazolonepropionase [Acidimicrobiia bacterium]|nr:imidazolonepropionase [Acidimicrobiia bacterium]